MPPPMPPPLNIPRLDLIVGSREEYIKVGVPLYEAANNGYWKAAKAIFDERPDLIRFAITENGDTPLHIAALAESTKSVEEFVGNLVNLMEPEDLELQNKNYNTAVSLAAAAGNVKMAMIMVRKNPVVLEIPGNNRMMPLYIAAVFAKADMVRYLYNCSREMSGDYWTYENRGWVLQKCVEADIFDVAMRIVEDRPELMAKKSVLTDVLLVLAQRTQAFERIRGNIIWKIINSIFCVEFGPAEMDSEAMQLVRIIWQKVARMPRPEIEDIIRGPVLEVKKQGHITKTYPSRVLFVAAKMGNTRFIIELFRLYPDIIWKTDDKGQTIFHVAVKRRHAEIYNLLHEIGAMKDFVTRIGDKEGNYMLHLVAKGAKPTRLQNVSGVALQMQRELLWFKEVEQIMLPALRQRKNRDGEKPTHVLFTKTHAELVTKGEDWMKTTASQCLVVATLIATIVFAAAFTLPGSYNQNTGIPFFCHKPSLIVFVISDAISLICSSTSVLMFLSILTSRYAERDFLESLPKKLLFGLATLFLSMLTMMIAFSASFFVLYDKKLEWVPILIAGLVGLPVILFAMLQFRLLGDIFYSAYQSKYLFKPKKRILKF